MVRSRNIRTAGLLQQFGEPDASRVPELISGLKHSDLLDRDAWCDLLKDVGTAAVPGLIELLNDADPNIRWHAVETLAEIGGNSESICKSLASCLADYDVAIRVTAALALSKFNVAADQAVPILIACLHDADVDNYDDECTKIEACQALGDFSPPTDEVVGELIAALDDPVACVAAAESLAKHGPAASVATSRLRELMTQPVPPCPDGSDMTAQRHWRHGFDAMCIAVARALFQIVGECHEEALIGIILRPDTYLLHRPSAIELLGKMPFGDQSTRVLRGISENPNEPHLKQLAETALRRR